MSTNVDRVKRALEAIPGNRVFTTHNVHSLLATGNEDDLTPKQVGEAVRAVPYAQKLKGGRYRIKGRKTA